jgi:hypothetical protein
MSNTRRIALALAIGVGAGQSDAQDTPKFAHWTASRILVLPAQEVAGAPETRDWLSRFDSTFTARLEDGGIGPGWAYPRDAARYARSNPTYISDPRAMGAQLLKGEKVKAGVPLPEPFASRVRALVAVADARRVLVPVVVRIDSTLTPRSAKLQLMLVDALTSRVEWVGTVESRFIGAPAIAADSLAVTTARLFVGGSP